MSIVDGRSKRAYGRKVIESDLAKNLAALQEEEETAQDNYDQLTQESHCHIATASKVPRVESGFPAAQYISGPHTY